MADTENKNNLTDSVLVWLDDKIGIAVEKSVNPSYPNEVYVGLMTKDGVWFQDIVMVRTPYEYTDDGIDFKKDQIEILSYEDENSEDYTRNVKVPIIDPDAV